MSEKEGNMLDYVLVLFFYMSNTSQTIEGFTSRESCQAAVVVSSHISSNLKAFCVERK